MKSFIYIAIDGGAGSGKSTTAHNISSKFNFLNVDTGSHYRSITAYSIKHNISEIAASNPGNLNKITLSSKIINNKSQIQINGSSFSHSELRSKEINLNVPLVVRLAGTNFKQGKKILEQSGLKILSASDLNDAARKIVEAIK